MFLFTAVVFIFIDVSHDIVFVVEMCAFSAFNEFQSRNLKAQSNEVNELHK